jgi:hypothetical protein
VVIDEHLDGQAKRSRRRLVLRRDQVPDEGLAKRRSILQRRSPGPGCFFRGDPSGSLFLGLVPIPPGRPMAEAGRVYTNRDGFAVVVVDVDGM